MRFAVVGEELLRVFSPLQIGPRVIHDAVEREVFALCPPLPEPERRFRYVYVLAVLPEGGAQVVQRGIGSGPPESRVVPRALDCHGLLAMCGEGVRRGRKRLFHLVRFGVHGLAHDFPACRRVRRVGKRDINGQLLFAHARPDEYIVCVRRPADAIN